MTTTIDPATNVHNRDIELISQNSGHNIYELENMVTDIIALCHGF